MASPRTAHESLDGSVAGEAEAQKRLLQLVYDDLRAVASKRMRGESQDHTLQPTALVHEAFLRLIDQDRVDIRGRTHFFALAATTMRRVLVDHARGKQATKRGGSSKPEVLEDHQIVRWDDPTEVLALDEALLKLAGTQPRQAQVVELRFFGGLTLEETASALGVSRDTVKLDWRFARAWLNRELGG
ncbi:MAG: sigma-70 family RNA polymerase sigma factor [bacterium]|nr:sigma-70 family RNA polymerase sigma factor [bacterium]